MTDGQAVPPPADAITAAAERIRAWFPDESWQPGEPEKVARSLLAAARPHILADAHLVPDSLIDETRRDENQACARLAEQQADEWRYAPFGAAIAKAFRGLADLIRARNTP